MGKTYRDFPPLFLSIQVAQAEKEDWVCDLSSSDLGPLTALKGCNRLEVGFPDVF